MGDNPAVALKDLIIQTTEKIKTNTEKARFNKKTEFCWVFYSESGVSEAT